MKKILGYSVHLFTALGAVFGLLSLYAIYQQNYILSFWYMGITILIDSIDGTFARAVDIKKTAPKIDGALLDNIIDFLTYVIAPAFMFIVSGMLPPIWNIVAPSLVVIASSYQFTQSDAKTDDHFFKGFPDYWNVLALYLFIWKLPPTINLLIILLLVVLVFVPIKYIYPSRMDFVSRSKNVRSALLVGTILWGVATLGMLITYPNIPAMLNYYSLGFCAVYTGFSIYRTFVPLSK